MSVSDNRISAVHKTGRHMLQTHARLAASVVAREFGYRPQQSDAIADAASEAVLHLLEQWEQESTQPSINA